MSKKEVEINVDLKELTGLITCFNCSKIYDVPKILPCGNSICRKCLVKAQSKLFCNMCSTEHLLAPDDELKTNFAILDLVKSVKQTTYKEKNVFFSDEEQTHGKPGEKNTEFTEQIKLSSQRKLNEKLYLYLSNVKQKIDKITDSYKITRESIISDCRHVEEEINSAVDEIIRDLEVKKMKMIKDVEARKNELLADFLERYDRNPDVKKFLADLQTNFNRHVSIFRI